MKDDFEVVHSSRGETITPEYIGVNEPEKYGNVRLSAGNIDGIINIARDIAEIYKIKTQSDALIAILAEKKELLKTEAEAYVLKKQTDSKAVVDKMEAVRLILKDYYQHNGGNVVLSGEVFAQIIADALRG